MEFGDKRADVPLVFDPNGEGALPVRGAMDFNGKGGEPALLLANVEGWGA